MALEWIHPDELRNHPTNLSIYGDTPDQELVESVRKYGVFPDHPIGYVVDGDFRRIVSGHRRNQAAKMTKQDMVPVVRLKELEGDPLAIEERIILSNKQRVKTADQLAKEAARLADIESKRAEARKIGNLKQSTECTHTGTLGAPKRTEQAVGEKLGIGRRKAKDLITAGKALADAESKGQTEKAERIKEGLEKSAAAGARAAAPPKPPKNGSVIQPAYDEKKIDKPLGVIRRELDERVKAYPSTDRLFRAAKYALSQFCDAVEAWRAGK